MRSAKTYIPLLISFSLLALIGLQVLWLFSVYEYKNRELKNKTQEALLETTFRLQREEDSKLILTNMDSLLVADTLIHRNTKAGVQYIVSTLKNKVLSGGVNDTLVEKDVRVINDSTSSTTIVRMGHKDKNTVVTVRSQSMDVKGVKQKAGDLQKIFMQMALGVKDVGNIYKRIDFKHIQLLLAEELLNRGIDLRPEVIIMPTFRGKFKKSFVPLATDKWKKVDVIASAPLFPNNFTDLNLSLSAGYLSTGNFVIKQMGGLLALSVIITLLVCFVMLLVFKRMLNQEKLHQLKTDFINNMTHELKTPIATISLAVDSINNPTVHSDHNKLLGYTGIIKEENKKLDQHVERVLQMALLEKGEIQLEEQTINLVNLINEVIKRNQLRLEACKGQIILNTTLNNPTIKGDEFALGNALNNLIDNSLKYSNEPCNIEIVLTREADAMKIEVRDNGIGMDKADLPLIFDKFYRVHRGNLHDVKGSGLGLSYVRSIIELHKGTINVSSEPGKGSTFTIKLKADA